MIALVGIAAMIFWETSNGACSVANMSNERDGEELTVSGVLVRTRHSVYLKGRNEDGCNVFVVFPGTPASLTPGIIGQEGRRDPKLEAFVETYLSHLRQHPGQFWTVEIQGQARVAPKGGDSSKVRWFGGGSFRTAIIVRKIVKP